MKANKAALRRARAEDDRAVAGVVAGVLMLGGIVAFLAYMNVAWVPQWVAGREATYAAGVHSEMGAFADLTEAQAAREQTRSYSATFSLGTRGIPFLGTGASSSELVVAGGPLLEVRSAGQPLVTAGGSLAFSTHTLHYPNQTYRYVLGAMETTQPDGAWVDLRNVLTLTRSTGGQLSLAIQAVDITSPPQQTGGNGEATAIGVVTNVSTTTDASALPHRVTLVADQVSAGAWRAALNRTLASNGLTTVQQDCNAAIPGGAHACFPSGNNTATRAELILLSVAPGWSARSAKVSVTLTS